MNAQMFSMLIKLTMVMKASFWLVVPWYAQTLQIVGKSPTRERELWGQRPRNHLCDQIADSDQTQSWWLQYGTECRSQNVGYGVSSTVGSTVCSTTLCSTGSVHILSSTGNCLVQLVVQFCVVQALCIFCLAQETVGRQRQRQSIRWVLNKERFSSSILLDPE